MTLYCFYHVGPDGHFKRIEAERCATDAEALAIAGLRNRQDDVAIEVWDMARFVARVETPKPPKYERPADDFSVLVLSGTAIDKPR